MHSYDTYNFDDEGTVKSTGVTRKTIISSIVFAVVVVIVVVFIQVMGIFYAMDVFDFEQPSENPFQGDISIFKIMEHLENFNKIATFYNNSRSVNYGYNESAEYVIKQLSAFPEYYPNITRQYFDIPLVRNLEPPQLSQYLPTFVEFVLGVDFDSMPYSGSGDATNYLVYIPNGGCESEDYEQAGYSEGNIALLMHSSACRTADRAALAQDMLVTALLIYNNQEGLFSSSAKTPYNFPIYGLSHDTGTTLMHMVTTGTNVSISVKSVTQTYAITTYNVLVDTPGSNADQVIVSGSHLDSVDQGPGINDNGSGSASNLEIALLYARMNVKPVNVVRFAWWSGEELGLKGSTYYVTDLQTNNPTGLAKIALNVNYDMLGSPNYFRGVYNGTQAKENIRLASEKIMSLYVQFFENNNITWSGTEFTGRSDYGPFLDADKPAGGLFSGAEVKKTAAERDMYGGIANASYDTCYHLACDTVDNINREVLDEMAKAAGFAVFTLSQTVNLTEFLSSPA